MPDAKALYRDATNIGAFIKEFGYGVGHTFFMIITFRNNDLRGGLLYNARKG